MTSPYEEVTAVKYTNILHGNVAKMLKSCGTMRGMNIFRKNSDIHTFLVTARGCLRSRDANGSLQFAETIGNCVVFHQDSILCLVMIHFEVKSDLKTVFGLFSDSI